MPFYKLCTIRAYVRGARSSWSLFSAEKNLKFFKVGVHLKFTKKCEFLFYSDFEEGRSAETLWRKEDRTWQNNTSGKRKGKDVYLSLLWGKSFCLFFFFDAFASDFKIPAAVHRFGCHSNENSIFLFSNWFQRFTRLSRLHLICDTVCDVT